MTKKHILFVTEKYCEPNNPIESNHSNTFHNIFETCDQSSLFTREHLWLDADTNINLLLKTKFNLQSTKITDYLIFSYLAYSNKNPSLETIKEIKRNFPLIQLIFLWWDAVHPYCQEQIRLLDEYADLHVNFDGSDLSHLTNKAFFCGVPQSTRLFFNDSVKQRDIAFCGRTSGYIERCTYLNYLQHHLQISIAGGRTEQNLSIEDYAKILRQSRININFCNTAGGIPQCKGRVWEILASNTLLLEQDNNITSKYLEPNKHYIPFASSSDLVYKAWNLINHTKKRQEIIKAASEIYKEKYHSDVLWKKIYNL